MLHRLSHKLPFFTCRSYSSYDLSSNNKTFNLCLPRSQPVFAVDNFTLISPVLLTANLPTVCSVFAEFSFNVPVNLSADTFSREKKKTNTSRKKKKKSFEFFFVLIIIIIIIRSSSLKLRSKSNGTNFSLSLSLFYRVFFCVYISNETTTKTKPTTTTTSVTKAL